MVTPEADWRDVLQFWFGDDFGSAWPAAACEARWFGGGPALDEEIRARFGGLVEQALHGAWTEWEARADSRLALIVLLDQFSRNVFRGQGRAFAGDARAVALVTEGLALNLDRELPWAGRVFFYMPLMHAEDMDLQQQCIDCFAGAAAQAPDEIAEKLRNNLKFAREHAEIIARYGRFPYRNAALGRDSTAAELEFLEHGPRFGQ